MPEAVGCQQGRLVAGEPVLGGDGVHGLGQYRRVGSQVQPDGGHALVRPPPHVERNAQGIQERDQNLSVAKPVSRREGGRSYAHEDVRAMEQFVARRDPRTRLPVKEVGHPGGCSGPRFHQHFQPERLHRAHGVRHEGNASLPRRGLPAHADDHGSHHCCTTLRTRSPFSMDLPQGESHGH